VKLNVHKIEFPLRTIQNYVITFPFYLEVQTSSRSIEQYCVKNFNDLIGYTELNITELYKLQKMKAYIKGRLTSSDIKDMIDIFVSKGWFTNIITGNSSIFKFKIDECRCKMSSDILPFLLINGSFSINIKTLINWYVAQNKISVKHTGNNITRATAEIVFNEPVPYVLGYERSHDIRSSILELISDLCHKSSPLSTSLAKAIGLEKITELKKEISWIDDRRIKIAVTGMAVLKAKARKNWVPLTLGAIYLYNKRQKKKKLAVLNQQLNIFQQMVDLVKEAGNDEDFLEGD